MINKKIYFTEFLLKDLGIKYNVHDLEYKPVMGCMCLELSKEEVEEILDELEQDIFYED